LNDKFSREEALEADKFVGVDQPFVYDVEDLMTTVAITGPNYYTTVTGAVEVAMQIGDFVKLAVDADLEDGLVLESDLVFNLGGKALSANGKTLAIADEKNLVNYHGGRLQPSAMWYNSEVKEI
jgi:hypothetical protein